MACTAQLVADAAPEAAVRPRAMTRCECAELAFSEIRRQVQEDGRSLEEVSRRTGCGRLCTACVPDLQAYLLATSGGK
jgi:bacterioferritin-associated ferredoxin